MEGIVGLKLEVQESPGVVPVRTAPGVAARGRLEVSTAEQRWYVIKDGAEQSVGGVRVPSAVIVISSATSRTSLPESRPSSSALAAMLALTRGSM
jgi:hypothetical protein